MAVFDFSLTGPETVPQRTDRTPEDWLSSTAAWLLGRTPQAFKPAKCPAEGLNKELRDISGLWMGELTCRSKNSQRDTQPGMADGRQDLAGVFRTRVRGRVPVIGRTEARLAHRYQGDQRRGPPHFSFDKGE